MMKNSTYLAALVVALLFSFTSYAQTEWTGPTITIMKENFADWTLPENQDVLTDNVILTRATNRGIFNIAIENEYDNTDFTSPLDTEWANGSIEDGVGTLTFMTWDAANDEQSPQLNENKVCHLITDDIYIDFVITQWTMGDGGGTSGGGGYSYTRSTDDSTSSIDDLKQENELTIAPNPSTDFIQVKGINEPTPYQLIDITGKIVAQGTLLVNEQIEVSALNAGTYFISIAESQKLQFIKK